MRRWPIVIKQQLNIKSLKQKKLDISQIMYMMNSSQKKIFPAMSSPFKKEIVRSLLEIFENARIHGECINVYTCGQYFPNYKLLDFTIVDFGKTIKENVSDFFSKDVTGIQAIKWAVRRDTTTKRGISGGLGLDISREFSKKNGGKIQIISADGYWEQNHSDIICEEFFKYFSWNSGKS